ncbi:MAG TPA: hypothetical protein VFI82_09380 [Terriglobales bacterium]|jgi:hypothetical protein|nr:hypothetical protein [Terriglobales bacterium]
MPNWRKALVIGSLSAGALMFIKGHRPAGVALASVGLAVLAAEYPEKFESVWENAPDYIYRGTQIFSTLSRIAERFADEAGRRGAIEAFRDISAEYAR